ncbi:MAG: tetratricopeptide (TPR) repeat protein [Crocinitomicaceae bacterium]|jgi:tetratricopeptide (TPR) repeat protein
MKSIFTTTTLIVIFFSFTGVAQLTERDVREMVANSSESQLVTQSSMLTQEGYLYYAEIITDRLIQLKPLSANYNYRKGFLMLDIRKDYMGAIPFLEKAILDVDPNYDMYSSKEESSAVDAIFHLATCYHLNEEIDKAIEHYNMFKAASNKKSELLPVSDLRIAQCQQAKIQMSSPGNVYLTNMGDKINSDMPEYSPVISLDGSALYYTSRRVWENNETDEFKDPRINQYPEDVYVSYLDFDSTWTDPIRLEFCKAQQNEATIAISSDERKIYLYEDSTGNGDIYYTDFYHAKFRDIQKLEMKDINTKYWETHAMMSHRKDLFFFVSDRPGGLGGRDIYYVKLAADGTWGSPINLGPNVNGPNDDDAPFIAVDNHTLYFATNDERSIGGFDIMRTQLQDDGSWSKATNLGYPFNSTNDDIFYTTTLDGRRGYMTSFRKDGKGEKDIYEIHNDYLGMRDVAVLKGIIRTLDNKPLPEDFAINVKLVCIDCDENGIERLVYPRLRDGVFMTGLDACKTYRLEYTNITEDKLLHEDTFTTLCDTNYQEIYRELLLNVDTREIILPPVIELPVIPIVSQVNLEFMHYFAYNKNKLTTNKGKLKKFMKDVEDQLKEGREQITINVFSSASYVPTKTFGTNERLTEIRAENMKYDLISYFEKNPDYAGKVNVVIVTKVVQGPVYEADAVNKEKYFPYQYVGLKTE